MVFLSSPIDSLPAHTSALFRLDKIRQSLSRRLTPAIFKRCYTVARRARDGFGRRTVRKITGRGTVRMVQYADRSWVWCPSKPVIAI